MFDADMQHGTVDASLPRRLRCLEVHDRSRSNSSRTVKQVLVVGGHEQEAKWFLATGMLIEARVVSGQCCPKRAQAVIDCCPSASTEYFRTYRILRARHWLCTEMTLYMV